jgi:hypothetical protein
MAQRERFAGRVNDEWLARRTVEIIVIYNLRRAELTVQERSEHVAEWARLTEGKAAGAIS